MTLDLGLYTGLLFGIRSFEHVFRKPMVLSMIYMFLQYAICIHTHTRTHTYIYIYIDL